MKISIILPTYNRASTFLKEAIDSVFNQDYKNWELIIIDNNSSDNTLELIKKYNSEKISIYSINNNGIIAKSRNLGIKKSKGDYIAFLDSDDYWYKNKLQKCINAIKSGNYPIVCHGEKWLYSNSSIDKIYGPKEKFIYSKMLSLGSSPVSTSAVLIDKKLIYKAGLFSEDEDIITAEDYDMWLNVANIETNIKFIDESLGVFRVHEKSQSSNIYFNTNSIINVLSHHYDNNKSTPNPIKKISYSRVWINAAKTLQIKGQYADSFKAYQRGLQLKFSLKVILLMASLLVPYKFFKIIYFSIK